VADELRLLVTGTRDIARSLQRVERAATVAAIDEARDLAAAVAARARELAPRDTDELHDNIRVRSTRRGARITSAAKHSYYVHQGTQYRDADPFLADSFEQLGLGNAATIEAAFEDAFLDGLTRI
jgi:hypothetical protein